MVLMLIIGCVLWYILTGFEGAINGGLAGRNPLLMPFQLFGEALPWYLPGGIKRRGEYIRKRVCHGHGVILGTKYSWKYNQIRDENLYEECAADTLPGPFYFWALNLGTLFGPLVLWKVFH